MGVIVKALRYLIHFTFLVFVSIFSIQTNAQTDMSMYSRGKIITATGETLTVHIRKVSDDKLAKSITVLSDDSLETKKISAKDLIKVELDGEVYLSKLHDKKKYLMKVIIDGPATMYELNIKERKGNKSTLETYYYAEKIETEQFVMVEKKSFRIVMSDFVKDFKDLSSKIQEKYYTYEEKEAVIEEYNEWVKQGKPGKTWTPQDGNFTRPDKEYNTVTKITKPKQQFINSRWGIDIPLMGTYCFVTYPDILNYAGVVTKNGGFGYNVGIGARFDLSQSLLLRGGVNFRNKSFDSFYQAYDADTNLFNVNETGEIHYFGLYLMAHYESRNLIVGGGFDFGFVNIYRAKYRITDLGGTLYGGDENESESILAPDGFNVQFDLTFNFGYKINLMQDQIKLKPVFQYSIPLVTLFDIDLQTSPPQSAGMSGYLVQLGMIIDVGFKKKTPVIPITDLN